MLSAVPPKQRKKWTRRTKVGRPVGHEQTGQLTEEERETHRRIEFKEVSSPSEFARLDHTEKPVATKHATDGHPDHAYDPSKHELYW